MSNAFRSCLCALVVWLWPAVARPVPPADFAGAQYIDAAGCVMLRQGRDWVPRLMRDGSPDCGYPPTPLPGGALAGRLVDLPLAPTGSEAEARLWAIMAEDMKPGDLRGDAGVAALTQAPPPPPSPRPHPVASNITAALGPAGAQARDLMAGQRPNGRLCDLLGQKISGQQIWGQPILGADPTRGFCPGEGPDIAALALRPAAVLPLPAATMPPEAAFAASEARARPDAQDRAAGSTRHTTPPAPRSAPVSASHSAPGTATAAIRPAPGAPIAEGMIPAHARYLQLGLYRDPVQAEAAVRRAAALGLPVARGRPATGTGMVILAGPFDSRQAIVRGYDSLRRAGFARITPR